MSTRYPGGVITKTPVVPAGPYENGTAPGIWTLDQQLQAAKSGIWPTAGNIDPSQFIENIFSTYLYTGNGSTQTITNGIDLSGKGGLVWLKSRGSVQPHWFVDTARGVNKRLESNNTNAESTLIDSFPSFNADGFTLGTNAGNVNTNGVAQCSWTFREQPKFFDIVTYTGDGSGAGRDIPHNLASKPGCVIVKCISSGGTNWPVGFGNSDAYLYLNSTDASPQLSTGYVDNYYSTATTFRIDGQPTDINVSGQTYVAYLFAHNAGGFGLTGTDNVISCGSFTTDGSGNFTVNLGYEPQWLMFKRTDSTSNWVMIDNMRGWTASGDEQRLLANTSGAETTASNYESLTATGFQSLAGSYAASSSYIYIAIRRGPMKVPTSGTSVFSPVSIASAAGTPVTTGFTVDLILNGTNTATDSSNYGFYDRLRGIPSVSSGNATGSISSSTAAEVANPIVRNANNLGFQVGSYNGTNQQILHSFARAPGFFDEVCYTGTGNTTTVPHNLTTVPELMIIKARSSVSGTANWKVYSSATGPTGSLLLNTTAAFSADSGDYNNTAPTASVFTVRFNVTVNELGATYVAYLFATVAGVSKVGSYTGTGTTQVINCGFTSGARFVLIKRTDSTGDWYVWDSARGIVAGNDPYLLLNSTAAEVTNTDYVDTAASGFEISSTAPAAINANGGSFIFLAVS